MRRVPPLLLAISLFFHVASVWRTEAAIQFDVFLGYDGVIPEATWFPVVCEIKNDGPSFNGAVEMEPLNFNQGQTRRMVVELPTGTLKRVVLPCFASIRSYATWNVRLLDDSGKIRAEQVGLRPRRTVSAGVPVFGALPRSPSGTPTLAPVKVPDAEKQPVAARFQTSLFPDNPLVLEGMTCLYLNSERAAELSPGQINALTRWLLSGGHLIVGIEQLNDVAAQPWLKAIFPWDLKELQTVRAHKELQQWLESTQEEVTRTEQSAPQPRGQAAFARRYGIPAGPRRPAEVVSDQVQPFAGLDSDSRFEAAPLQVASAAARDKTAQVVLAVEDKPLIVSVNRGRGKVTGLLFSPEREPFRSWTHLPVFWAKLASVPPRLYASTDYTRGMSLSTDGVFGAMLDTRQVNKVPVTWLLLLLLVYLVVIGPLDQYWLKRLGRPMLTWITFPGYVVFFSLLIYFIGYKLRAGESEYNELHLVDIVPEGPSAELRGRTFASIYAPSNNRYRLQGGQGFAALRGEFAAIYGGGEQSDKMAVTQVGDSFRADVFVPVWMSRLIVSDWCDSTVPPLSINVSPDPDPVQGWTATVENRTGRKLANGQLVLADKIFLLGELPPGQSKFSSSGLQSVSLRAYVQQHSATFQQAIQNRSRMFGGGETMHLDDLQNSSVAVSFPSQIPVSADYAVASGFVGPPGLDLTSTIQNGNAVLLAWDAGQSPIAPINKFTARRLQRNTLWRVLAR